MVAIGVGENQVVQRANAAALQKIHDLWEIFKISRVDQHSTALWKNQKRQISGLGQDAVHAKIRCDDVEPPVATLG